MHALEITHGLLKRDGLLIDIHPNSKPGTIRKIANTMEKTKMSKDSLFTFGRLLVEQNSWINY